MKTILITGGSRGIGRGAAIVAGRRGWAVGVNYAGNAQAAEDTAAAVRAAGGRALAVKGDVVEEADVAAMFEAVETEFGQLDGVFVNAGVIAPGSLLADMTAERMRRIFEINVLGSYLTAREAARRLSRSRGGKGGSVVIMSSAAARLGAAGEYVDYAGAKAAMDTLTIGLSKELGPEGIRVNAVRPGLIETDIHAAGGAPDRAARLGAGTPLGRAGTPDEVGEAVVWLLSDASSYVTGAILDVSGGR
jgi:NAD(P)-dependent dehydrogenase (short-subunit alcohol dehydrogenase family)